MLRIRLEQPQWSDSGTLLEKFWRISLYSTDDAIAKLYICDVKFSQIEGNGRNFRHIASSVKFSNGVWLNIAN